MSQRIIEGFSLPRVGMPGTSDMSRIVPAGPLREPSARSLEAQALSIRPLETRRPLMDFHLAGAATPGLRGFVLKVVGRWFRARSLNARAGLPETVRVPMPGGGTVDFSGKSLAGMIKSLPRLDRAAARENLAAKLEARLEHGAALMSLIQSDGDLGAPGAQDVADLMLFFWKPGRRPPAMGSRKGRSVLKTPTAAWRPFSTAVRKNISAVPAI